VTEDPEMGELDPAVAAKLEELVIGHRLDHIELDTAISYRNDIVARAANRMRAEGHPEREIQTMVAEALEAPYAAWIDAMRSPDDFGPWNE